MTITANNIPEPAQPLMATEPTASLPLQQASQRVFQRSQPIDRQSAKAIAYCHRAKMLKKDCSA